MHATIQKNHQNVRMFLRSIILHFLFSAGREPSVCNLLSHQVTRQTLWKCKPRSLQFPLRALEGRKQITTYSFLCTLIFFPILVWCVILCTYLLRNTRCEITLQVWKHFSVSETGLSTPQTVPWKSCQQTHNGEWACASTAEQQQGPRRTAHSRRWSAQAIFPFGAVGMELIFQIKACSFCREHPELPPVPR